jgi:hypothetical protein
VLSAGAVAGTTSALFLVATIHLLAIQLESRDRRPKSFRAAGHRRWICITMHMLHRTTGR